VRTEADAAIALLSDYVDNPSVPLKTSAIMGLGLAYVGSHREDVLWILLQHVADESVSMEIASLSALALGFVFVGSGNGEITSTILQTMMERDEHALDEKWGRFMALGLALLYLGRSSIFSFVSRLGELRLFSRQSGLQDTSDATIETLKAIEHPLSKTAQILVEVCSFAGTGNVLKVQAMLYHCDEHIDTSKDKEKGKETEEAANKEAASKEDEGKAGTKVDDTFQAFAVLGIALLAMGEDIGAEMSLRQFNHLVRIESS
jgi:26S proteasome regulatory subunit N1